MNRILTVAALLALPLAACSDRTSEPADRNTSAAGPGIPTSQPAASDSAATPTPVPTLGEATSNALPSEMQGRFGLVPADCTSTRGDNKGLVTITASEMKFYESVAVPKTVKPTSATQVRGNFAYSGEGMEWAREVSLDLRDNGKTLIMEEFGDDAPAGPRTYTRCG